MNPPDLPNDEDLFKILHSWAAKNNIDGILNRLRIDGYTDVAPPSLPNIVAVAHLFDLLYQPSRSFTTDTEEKHLFERLLGGYVSRIDIAAAFISKGIPYEIGRNGSIFLKAKRKRTRGLKRL